MALSRRGEAASKPKGTQLIWEILQNLWSPGENPDGFVSLGVAENALMHDVLAKRIKATPDLPHVGFTYGDGPAGSKRLKRAMARFLSNRLRSFTTIEPAHITITNGCSAALEHLSWTLANPGDGILLGQPYYGTFIPDLTLRSGAEVVRVSFGDVDPLRLDGVQKYEDAILAAENAGQRIAALVLCNPHNPLGRCYPRQVVIGLMRLCQKYQIHLVSDEIYALSVWTNSEDERASRRSFESCLSIDLDGVIDPRLVHFIWGMSKDFGANGIRLAAIVSQQNADVHAAILSAALYSSASSLAEHAAADILEDDAWVDSYLAENRRKLAEHHSLVVKWARQHDITYAPGVNAAFFLWVDLGTAYKRRHPDQEVGDIDAELMSLLLSKKIFLASGKKFGSERAGWFRIVFSNEASLLEEGLRRIMLALES